MSAIIPGVDFALLLLLWVTPVSRSGADGDLVEVRAVNPRIRVELRYATTNNFTGRKLYHGAKCYLRRGAAEKLSAVQATLERSGFGLLIWDAYRPHSVQKALWELLPDPRYVARPEKGSRHNRGSAVDVTLVRGDGEHVVMPTDFDDFTAKAHYKFKALPAEVIAHRTLLKETMEQHGFVPLATEWWHFDDREWKNYEVLDVSFAELEKSVSVPADAAAAK
jgi:D-alanyl-D-alanine dipeptidase